VAPPVSFTDILDASFEQIRQNAGSSAAVTIRLLEVLAIIAESADRPEHREAVLRHARLIANGGKVLPEEADRTIVDERLRAILQVLNVRG
jgi:uncharacterized membrane protein